MKIIGTAVVCRGLGKYDPEQDLLLDSDSFEDEARFMTWRLKGQLLPGGCEIFAICVGSGNGCHMLYDLPVSQEVAAYLDGVCDALEVGRRYGHSELHRLYAAPTSSSELDDRVGERVGLEPDEDEPMYRSEEDVLAITLEGLRVA